MRGSAKSRILESLRDLALTCDSQVSLQAAADKSGFSKYYYCRTFRQLFGMGFVKYRTVMRICCAAALLKKNSDLSITEVCYSSGYADLANFIRAFRLQIGCSPRQYRRCHMTRMSCPKRKNTNLALIRLLSIKLADIKLALPNDFWKICELDLKSPAPKKAISAKNF